MRLTSVIIPFESDYIKLVDDIQYINSCGVDFGVYINDALNNVSANLNIGPTDCYDLEDWEDSEWISVAYDTFVRNFPDATPDEHEYFVTSSQRISETVHNALIAPVMNIYNSFGISSVFMIRYHSMMARDLVVLLEGIA